MYLTLFFESCSASPQKVFVPILSRNKTIKTTDFNQLSVFLTHLYDRGKAVHFFCSFSKNAKFCSKNLRQKYAFFGLEELKAKSEIDAIFCTMFHLEKYHIFAV
jgi:hypothetical protein